MALTQFNKWEPTLDPVNGRQAQEPRVFAHDAAPVVVGAINNSDSNHGLNMSSGGSGYAVDDTISLTRPTGSGHAAGDKAVVVVTATDSIDVNLASSVNRSLLGGTTVVFSGATNTSYTDLEPGVSAGVTTTGGTGLKLSLTVAGGVATILTVTTAGTGFADGNIITFASGTFGGGANMVVTIGKGAITDYYVKQVDGVTNKNYLVDDTANQDSTSSTGISFASIVSNIDIPHTQKRGACIYVGAGLTQLDVVMESGNAASFKTISGGTILPILIKGITTTGLSANDVIALY